MSRPKPKVLLEQIDKNTHISEQVLESEGIWAVYYQGKPINLKTQHVLIRYPGPKYKRVSFSNKGHAVNLAKKLNRQFSTKDFSVVLLKKSEQIYP